MAESKEAVARLLERARLGDQDAAHEIIATYSPSILRVVRRYIAERIRTCVDSTDLVQEVWASFFGKALRDGPFDQSKSLLRFLVVMAKHKVIQMNRRYLDRSKRDLGRERSLESCLVRGRNQLVVLGPSAEERVMAREEYEQLLEHVPHSYRRVLEMMHDGYSSAEIGAMVGLQERTVRHIVHLLASEWWEYERGRGGACRKS